MKSKPPFSLGPGCTGTSNKIGANMRVKHVSNCKSYTTQKKEDKIQGHLQKDGSGAYPKEKVVVHRTAAVPKEHNISQPPETFRPLPEVSQYFTGVVSSFPPQMMCFSVILEGISYIEAAADCISLVF